MILGKPNDVKVFKHLNNYDNRGSLNCLIENYLTQSFAGFSLKISNSKKGVARGLHWQKPKAAQEKTITLLRGKIVDVIINLNTTSPDYGKVYRFSISASDRESLIIPSHYAHGFLALEDTEFLYLCNGKYSAECEISISISEFLSDIISEDHLIRSYKDSIAPRLSSTLLKDLMQSF